eukprot:TRINITY_DN6094_c0_g1_i2.p1 TRINITY_DN6094_c0_g1~~TRINITY_DN6094_c0_g1_i2.p1  ORF type:complete len:622 (-),score=158.41 TRINITY_DN6094_c0_g1_i2:54-1856(-)
MVKARPDGTQVIMTSTPPNEEKQNLAKETLDEPEQTKDPWKEIDAIFSKSEIYTRLKGLKTATRNRSDWDEYFTKERELFTLKANSRRLFIAMMKTMENIDKSAEVASIEKTQSFQELYCGSGGFSQHILNKLKSSSVFRNADAFALPIQEGGTDVLVSKREKRFTTTYLDITQNMPNSEKKSYDLVIANGWNDFNHSLGIPVPLAQKILILSQWVFGLSTLNMGGDFLTIFGHPETPFFASLMMLLERSFAKTQFFKPTTVNEWRSSFYILCSDLRSKDLIPILRSALDALKSGKDLDHLDVGTISEQDVSAIAQKLDPIWELQHVHLAMKTSTFPTIPGKQYRYSNDGDENGVVFNLLKNNEKDGLTVTTSGNAVGTALDFLSRAQNRCWTLNGQRAWFCVDLGESRKLVPSFYTLGYASSGNACCPRNWILQAAKELPESEDLANAPNLNALPNWKTLAIHTNDHSLNSEWAFRSFGLNSSEAFRYFRIVQTGANSYNSRGGDDNWSLVLVANRFELYGTMLDRDSVHGDDGHTLPMSYGNGGEVTSNKPTHLIRADPAVTRELQEMLVYLLRGQSDQKAVKVKVQDIIVDGHEENV